MIIFAIYGIRRSVTVFAIYGIRRLVTVFAKARYRTVP
jgi:hypothetical protein